MNIKKYLKNVWQDLRHDETGAIYADGGYKAPVKTPTLSEIISRIVKTYSQPGGLGVIKQPYQSGAAAYPSLNVYGTSPTGGEKVGPVGPISTKEIPSTPSIIKTTGQNTQLPTGVSGGGSVSGYSSGLVGAPEAPDLMAGLSGEDLSRLEQESSMLADLEFDPAFRQLANNLVESKRVAKEEAEGTIPVYEKSMRDTAATVANAIGSWAQRLNQLGMLRSGSYGRGASRLETAGIEQKGGLQKALAERLDDIQTRAADYERDVLDLRAGLEKEKGLRKATQFESLKRQELTYQRDTRQMAFQNEMQRANFVNTMDQMIWQRTMSERQLNAQLEAQSIENQMLQARMSQLYSSGSTGSNQVNPSDYALTYEELVNGGVSPEKAKSLLYQKGKELGLIAGEPQSMEDFLQSYTSGLNKAGVTTWSAPGYTTSAARGW